MAQHAGHTGRSSDVGQLRKQHSGQNHRQDALSDVMHRHGDAGRPAHQNRHIGGAQIAAAGLPRIHFFQSGEVKRHTGAAHQIRRQNHNDIAHTIPPYGSAGP